MSNLSHPSCAALLACAIAALALPVAADPPRIVFQNGKSVPISAVDAQADKLVIKISGDGFLAGQSYPMAAADHIFGEKPSAINPAIGLLLMGKPADALKLLEPILVEQRVTAKISGNFWLEAARAALVASAVTGNTAKCAELGKEISEATPAQGNDPFVALGKALLMPESANLDDRLVALGDLSTDNLPADVCAYAAFYRGNLISSLKRDKDPALALKRDAEALEAYLSVPCLYPSGGMILNGVAELRAAEFLVTMDRRDEAVALLKSSLRESAGTLVSVEANKRLESLK
jgi:tetratricopeptide (TPR) repeat protein